MTATSASTFHSQPGQKLCHFRQKQSEVLTLFFLNSVDNRKRVLRSIGHLFNTFMFFICSLVLRNSWVYYNVVFIPFRLNRLNGFKNSLYRKSECTPSPRVKVDIFLRDLETIGLLWASLANNAFIYFFAP